ncbi:MAG: ABC transporter ATP-binding protein [Variibacter sp.]
MTDAQPQDLKLEDVSRSFGPVVALERTTLTIAAGELLSLLGPSGCGKTTTLRIVAGFETPDTGRILVGGRDITGLSPNHRRLGMVFQDYSLFPHMTIGQNVSFGLRMAKLPRADITERTRRILDLVRLPGFDDRFPHQLSGGQQQRVALARSLVTNPSILLLDEPLGALDKNLRESMQFELRRIQQSLGITTVMVTHDQEEALTLSDRIAVMDRGRILQVGTPTEVYDRPRTRFVSEFLGTANLFVGRMAGGSGAAPVALAQREGSESQIQIAVPERDRRNEGDAVMIAVRPEKMHLTRSRNGADNAFEAQVMGHVFRGTHRAYQVSLPDGRGEVIVYQQAVSDGDEPVLAVGRRAWVSWSANDSIVVDPEA